MLENRYLLEIQGKNPKRFLQNLMKLHLRLLKITEKKDCYEILVSEADYKRILDVKTIYEVRVLRVYGPKQVKESFLQKKIFFFFLLISLLVLLFLCNVIFDVEVVHTKKEIRDLVTQELEQYGIEKLHLCVSFEKKEQIRAEILNKHKDKLEWMEIERVGTKYVIRVEERKLDSPSKQYEVQNIVAKKDGIITKIEAETGEVVAKKSQYVRKGDVLISGLIKNKDTPKALVQAKGLVKAETWYKVTVHVPTHYHEEQLTGNEKKTLQIHFLGKRWNLFDFRPYQNKKVEDHILLYNRLFSLSLGYNLEKEMHVTDKTYTREEAIEEAKRLATEKVTSTLGVNDRVLSQKDLKIVEEDSKIVVEVFLKVEEDITDYAPIVQEDSPKAE